ncbi:GNAT family N-acetyltransferase [Alkalihalobacillus trypoxylicola]|uniref:Acetoin dehydrogenase n=1 Tax=Alkalihalobacillus trypoxylicola TaxID=519424 RepID=A0A161P4B9_9BACI|nr:GNAT family N-acetyltransferase [Alkalihalobacillus trypoxylicola]KYG26685.1 acetoin dehydrogenase [Alkalihalobacillus trypoxylicola]GAF64276.1 acetoin utilization protein AcuA [Bacillus sp. TS-2]
MKHKKNYSSTQLAYKDRALILEGPVSSEKLKEYDFHPDLTSFRPVHEQKDALVEIADLPEGRINIIRDHDLVVGYVTFLYPDPLERWSEGNIENLIELGAIEIAPEYRGVKAGKTLLQMSISDPFMEEYIIITTEYYWHWDLKGSGLDVWEYRKMMEKMMNAGGLVWFATDDPEISSHPANCLMVRIGANVQPDTVQQFDLLRFQNRFMY